MNGPRSGQPARPGAPELLECAACRAGNRPHRGYCRACGGALVPVCRGCRFVNEAGDQFCGGCGSALVPLPAVAEPSLEAAAVIRSAPPPGSGAAPGATKPGRGPEGGARQRGDSELAALLAPRAAAAPKDDLPQANITQADLDRLFGGTS